MTEILQRFQEWETRIAPDVGHIQAILEEKLSDEPEKLIKDLQDAEAWNARAGSLLADANAWLDRASYALKPSREVGTEMDRRLELDSAVSPIRCVRDRIESLVEAIKQRLILGMSLLAYARQFKEHQTPVAPLRYG